VRAALKYGLLTALGMAAYVMLKHFALKQALPPWLDALVFNAFEFAGLARAIRARRTVQRGLTFGQGLKTGLSTAAVYAVAAGVFFAALYWAVGPALLQQAREPGVGERSTSAVLVGAFGGLFIGAMGCGLVFSLLLSALMRRSAPQSPA
jgi:hypothetical protein